MVRFDLSPEEITEGSIARVLLVLAAPLFVQNMVRVVQQVVDLFWVGHYSSTAVAAIGLATPVVTFLLTSSISAAFIGTQVLVSQRVGNDDTAGARRAAFTGLVLAGVFGIGVGAIMFFTVSPLLELVASTRPESTTTDAISLATRYLQVIALGIVFAGLSDVVEATFLGWGDSRATFYINVVTVVGNIGLDPVFIFGLGPIPEMGISGAAIATVAGYVAGFLLGGVFVVRERAGGIYSWATVQIDLGEIRELLEIGLPQAIQGGARSIGGLVMVTVVFSAAGPAGLAAYTVASRVGSLALRTSISLNRAVQTIVGQNLGAGNLARATNTVWTGVGIGVGILTTFGIGQWLAPGFITHVFVPEMDGQAFELAVAGLQIFAIGYPADAILRLVKAGFNGARLTKTTMVVSLIQTWLLQIPVAVVGGITLGFGAVGVFWAETLSIVAVAVGISGYYLYKINDGLYARAADRLEETPDH